VGAEPRAHAWPVKPAQGPRLVRGEGGHLTLLSHCERCPGGKSVITVQLRKVKSQELLAAVLDVLKRHYRSGYQIHKPRASLTYALTIDGPDEDLFLQDVRQIAAAARWTFAAEPTSRK